LKAQAELDRILAVDPQELTLDERAFLAARRSYLTEDQRITHGLTDEALDLLPKEEVVSSTESPKPTKTKKAKVATTTDTGTLQA